MKFRKKVEIVDAMRLTRDSFQDVTAWIQANGGDWRRAVNGNTAEWSGITVCRFGNDRLARWGDWIIKRDKGPFFVYEPRLFEHVYEQVTR